MEVLEEVKRLLLCRVVLEHRGAMVRVQDLDFLALQVWLSGVVTLDRLEVGLLRKKGLLRWDLAQPVVEAE